MEPGKRKGVASPMYARVFLYQFISILLTFCRQSGVLACPSPAEHTSYSHLPILLVFEDAKPLPPLLTVARRQSSLLRLCIETPRKGTELKQPGDENIISLAKEREINVDVYLEVPSSNRKSSEHSRHCCFYQVRRACLCAILQCVYDGCQYF